MQLVRILSVSMALSLMLFLSACGRSSAPAAAPATEAPVEAAADQEAPAVEEASEEAATEEPAEEASEEEAAEEAAAEEPTDEASEEEEIAEEAAAEEPTEEASEEEETAEEAAAEEPTDEASEEETAEESAAEEPAEEAEAAETLSESEMEEMGFLAVDPANFANSIAIDNQWLPMQPGVQWVFEGTSVEDDEAVPHRIEFTVTDLTKVVDGVNTVVAYIIDYADGEMVEAEIAFYAQDNDGNVWYFGEYPEEYEEGELVDAPTWISGQEGALAGIKMWADPQADTESYPQGWGPAVEWSDRGVVFAVGEETCVAVDCYDDVLTISEYSLDEPNAFQQKYYAPGVGNVQVGWRGEDAQQEELELIEYNQLDAEALAEIRDAALALEASAYANSPDVYGQTAPAEASGD